VKYNPNGKCKGYGYIQYETKEDADKAIIEMNNKSYKNGKLIVEPFKNSGSRTASFMNYNNLFVKNVPKGFSNKDIIDLFKPYGEIISAVVIKEHPDAPQNKGFGFVCFKKAEDAKNAEMKLNDLVIEGKNLYVCRALPKDEHRKKLREERYKIFKDCNLYVKELPEDIDNEKLKEAFGQFGKVVSAIVMLEKRQDLSSGKTEMKSRGFGFVCFNSKQEASKALMLSTKQPIFDRILYVTIAEKKEDRAARMSAMHFFGSRPPIFPCAFPPQPRKQRYVFALMINRMSIEHISHK
jgi:polyadenylate-binding protein